MRCFILLSDKTIINLEIVFFKIVPVWQTSKTFTDSRLFLKFLNTNVKCKDLKLGFAVRQSKLESFWMFKGQ